MKAKPVNVEQQTNKVVEILAELPEQEQEVIYKSLELARNRKLPVAQTADVISAFYHGRKVSFADKEGKVRVGVIKKVNQRFIKVQDDSDGKDYGILPDDLKLATEKDIQAATSQKPETKRNYTRRGVKRGDQPITNVKTDDSGKVVYGRRKGD